VLTLGARIDDPAAFVTRLNDLLTTLTDEPASDGREVDADDGGAAAADDG
jgi:molecular chaperone HtpG